MKHYHPLNLAVLMKALLIMSFVLGMYSIQPVTVVDAASGAPVAVNPALTLGQLPLKGATDLESEDSTDPSFIVVPQYDYVEGNNWTPETKVKLYTDGVKVAEATSDATGRVCFGYDGGSYNIAAGQVVKLTDGTHIEKHIVANIKVRSIDAVTEIVKGKAAPLSELIVGILIQGLTSQLTYLLPPMRRGSGWLISQE